MLLQDSLPWTATTSKLPNLNSKRWDMLEQLHPADDPSPHDATQAQHAQQLTNYQGRIGANFGANVHALR